MRVDAGQDHMDWSRRNLDKDFQTRTVDGALCALVGCVYLL